MFGDCNHSQNQDNDITSYPSHITPNMFSVNRATSKTPSGKAAALEDPRTPVVVAHTKTIDASAAECTAMNALLQRIEVGQIDLQSQLDILASDDIMSGLRRHSAANSMPKKK